jgi:hypothetical protein
MDTYRVVKIGIRQWAVERISENGSSDLLPTVYETASEAAGAVLDITAADLRRERPDLFMPPAKP